MTSQGEFTEGDCQGPLQDDGRIVDASSTDWATPRVKEVLEMCKGPCVVN